jgi:succinate dehydrogenase/fumarate reductase cytochrome b subunit
MRETASWTWFLIAGIVIFALLGLHMIVMHLTGLLRVFNPFGYDAVAWRNVVYRSRDLFFTVSYIILLGAALYHGFYGLRTIVFELGITKQAGKALSVFLWIVGVALFCIGTYVAIAARALQSL